MITVTPLCECGCGRSVSLRRGSPMRFLSGHNGRGRRKTPATLTCLNCHKTFEVRPHLASRKFCDIKCRNQFNHSHTGELNRCYKRVLVPCARCQKTASIVPNQLSRGRVPYCSDVCGKEARREKLRQAGKSFAKPHCWSFGKKAAEARDEKRCRICGFSVVYHVHHIKPRSKGGNNHLSNMITLCPNHHAMVHAGLLKQDYLLDIIRDLPTSIQVPRTKSKTQACLF